MRKTVFTEGGQCRWRRSPIRNNQTWLMLCYRRRVRRGELQSRCLWKTVSHVQELGTVQLVEGAGQESAAVSRHRQQVRGLHTAHTVLRVPGWLTNSSSSNSNSSTNSTSSSNNNQRAAVPPVYSATWRTSARTSQLWACNTNINRQLICAPPTSHFRAGPGNELRETAKRHVPILR